MVMRVLRSLFGRSANLRTTRVVVRAYGIVRINYDSGASGGIGHLCGFGSRCPVRHSSEHPQVEPPTAAKLKERVMLHYAVVFFVIALIASVLGFGGVAGMSAQIGWIFAVIAAVLLAVAVLGGRRGRSAISLP